jgi:hypothetical protein
MRSVVYTLTGQETGSSIPLRFCSSPTGPSGAFDIRCLLYTRSSVLGDRADLPVLFPASSRSRIDDDDVDREPQGRRDEVWKPLGREPISSGDVTEKMWDVGTCSTTDLIATGCPSFYSTSPSPSVHDDSAHREGLTKLAKTSSLMSRPSARGAFGRMIRR